jgi:hypothetical protein
MMVIVRSSGAAPEAPGVAVKLARPTPASLPDAANKTDFFCAAEAAALAALREAGWDIVGLRDGYHEDGKGGGVAIWGQGRYWEIRSDPFTVTEAVSPREPAANAAVDAEHVEVRRAIFGA